jgi:hypothetical protein
MPPDRTSIERKQKWDASSLPILLGFKFREAMNWTRGTTETSHYSKFSEEDVLTAKPRTREENMAKSKYPMKSG